MECLLQPPGQFLFALDIGHSVHSPPDSGQAESTYPTLPYLTLHTVPQRGRKERNAGATSSPWRTLRCDPPPTPPLSGTNSEVAR